VKSLGCLIPIYCDEVMVRGHEVSRFHERVTPIFEVAFRSPFGGVRFLSCVPCRAGEIVLSVLSGFRGRLLAHFASRDFSCSEKKLVRVGIFFWTGAF
jgi:hypothetical protein